MCVQACAWWSRAPMPSTSAPDAPGTAIWLANTPPTLPPQRQSLQWKEKMSENEHVCMTEEKKKACERQREGRKAEESNSWWVRSRTCCPLGLSRQIYSTSKHTNVLNTPTRPHSSIHTWPGAHTDDIAYTLAKSSLHLIAVKEKTNEMVLFWEGKCGEF